MEAKILFLSKSVCLGLQDSVAILTTRYKATDKHDYKKHFRGINNLRKNLKLDLILEAANTHVFKWRVYAEFDVHPYMKSHAGSTI